MSAVGGATQPAAAGPAPVTPVRVRSAPEWWPLAALTLLAAALRLATLDLQGLWYDEAFTPVHVLHPGLSATLHAVVHTENSPPLWYLIEWLDTRVLGTGAVALRLPSALYGIATVPVAWALGRELAPGPDGSSRRAAIACAALVAVNPLFVWYSQEGRVYGLFMLTAALAVLAFVRLRNAPGARRAAQFAAAGSLVLLTHYFAVFLLLPMAAILLFERGGAAPGARRAALPALAVQGAVGLALIPLISAQGGHGTQWIGHWPLHERLQGIPQYFLLGPSGEPLGHSIELLVALPAVVGIFAGLWYLLDRTDETAGRELRAARAMAIIAAAGVLVPLLLTLAGADYLAPRNLIGAMVPLAALIAVLCVAPAAGRLGVALLAITAIAFLTITLDVDLSPRLQRGDWRGLAKVLRTPAAPAAAGAGAGTAAGGSAGAGAGAPLRAITTVELGAAPLEYYLPGLRNLARGATVALREIDETGYRPLRRGAGRPPAAGFRLVTAREIHGLVIYRFVAPAPVPVSEAQLRRHVIAFARPEVLVPRNVRAQAGTY